jgi:hypothetical protein
LNIFAVSSEPDLCAQALDDRRLVKMTLETAQLLSSAVRHRLELAAAADVDALYKATHLNHPVSLWVRAAGDNFDWTRRLLDSLLREYGHRFERTHACVRIADALGASPQVSGMPRSWCNCTPFPDLPVFDAYCAYLAQKWQADARPPSWRGRGAPDWAAVASGHGEFAFCFGEGHGGGD